MYFVQAQMLPNCTSIVNFSLDEQSSQKELAMCLHVLHFNQWAPLTETIKLAASEKLLNIFLQKETSHNMIDASLL